MYQVNWEAFPSETTIYGVFDPVEPQDNSSHYTVELPRDEVSFTKFLRKIRPLKDLNTPIESLFAFAKETLKTNLGSCYCSEQDLSNIIELYHDRTITPEKEFPGANEGERSEVYHDLYPGAGEAFITEHVEITKPVMLQGKLIKEGTVIKFYHKGPL